MLTGEVPARVAMGNGLTFELLWVAFFVWIFGLFLYSWFLPFIIAVPASLIRVAIPLAYFAWFFDGSWTLRDDLRYTASGILMLRQGFNPISIFFGEGGYDALLEQARGPHILYYWWNLLAQYLFGQYYYASVFLNVGLTFVVGYVMFRMARLSGFSEGYAQGLALLTLFHWDIVAWSSLMNLKDVMVMTLTVSTFYLFMKLSHRISLGSLVLVGITMTLLYRIRFYVPAMIVLVVAVWYVLFSSGKQKYVMVAAVGVGGVGFLSFLGLDSILSKVNTYIQPSVFGIIRMMLTPQPWSIEAAYGYLVLPSTFHWLLIVGFPTSALLLWKQSNELKLLLMYLGAALVLYGSFGDVQGPRHRVQIVFILLWLQFHFLWYLLKKRPHRTLVGNRSKLCPFGNTSTLHTHERGDGSLLAYTSNSYAKISRLFHIKP
jgi:hypothetical protein